MTPAEARFGGAKGGGYCWVGGLCSGLLDPGKVGVQFAHRFTTGLFWACMAFETI
jgi:hypothetical protein